MSETEFILLFDTVLRNIESQIDKWIINNNLDIDISRNGNVLNIIFHGDSEIVINSQVSIQELWLAAQNKGYHYRYDGHSWKDTRGGVDFYETFLKVCSVVSGISLKTEI
ncbi:MAG: iron donor protein CyaY [Bordetella sp.]|nr:MAG: iron donor protein CyaY [Bordetella sp.]